jgi:hypothetical protein
MKYYRQLIGPLVGLLCFGCDAALSVAVAQTKVDFPNFIRHNQGTVASPTPSPASTKADKGSVIAANATITVTLDGAGYITYYITDKWNVQGMPHDKTHVSSENHKSTLFKTPFSGTVTATMLSDGEVQISGTDAITQETLTWVSCQHMGKDDDVTWTQIQ